MRLRDLGLTVGEERPGPTNAITDVPGVRVGHVTLIEGEGSLVVGRGPVRTGVTVILPHDGDLATEPVFAGAHRLNGNGEMTGLEWIRESGLLTSPVALTNTSSVGVARDALVAMEARGRDPDTIAWALPVVAETWDGRLNDIDGMHVRAEHVAAALDAARGAGGTSVAEGGVGGGTGMICHGFKGGVGTSSRVVDLGGASFTLGVLVQANYGKRARLRLDGVPIGAAIPTSEVPSPWDAVAPDRARVAAHEGAGSIIVVVATDAPLLPDQLTRLAQRPALGIGRVGGTGANDSGDLILAFSTAQRGVTAVERDGPVVILRALAIDHLDPLFVAVIEATEEAIWNALVAASTMTGRDGITAHAIPHDRLLEVWHRARG
ncbi:MAG TPA: P1 family peptidase [Candidatus Sulfotelmatobacter sp.]|nr:P1 family peptidase [Candidatus Sulfotelmatobacter sp.]